MRLPGVVTLSCILEQHGPIFREGDIIGDDVQVGNGGHDVCVGVGIVEGRVVGWEGGGAGEGGHGRAEVG